MLWAWIMFCALDLHRRNINRAISDRMLPEIGMDTNDFNYGQTIFLVSFLAAELPSGLISKRVGADRWIPFIICCWSIVAGSQCFVKSRTGFYVIKVLLGLLMGGFIPDIVLWLTYFYKSTELPMRLAWFWTALSTVNIVGSLLAAGILRMRGINGWSGWQWLFLLEGIVSLIIGIFSWVLMPPGPCQTANWFRGKNGWFNEREEKIMVNRLLRDDPSKGDMNNRQGVGALMLLKVLKDWEMWPLYLIGLTTYIPPSPINTYISLILRELGFEVFEANLLAIPGQFLFAVNLLIITWVSTKYNERSIVASISNWWMFAFFVGLVAIPKASPWVRYALLTGVVSYPYCHAILVGWNARNSNAVRTRAVSAALYNMFVQSGNIVASNIYREEDKPLYIRSNRILLGIVCYNIIQFYAVKAFYIWRNKVRERQWSALTPEQQEDYVVNSTDEGLKRLDFRFAH
ncbi:permease of the major facilitator superfamily [Podospora australis]|uniref:Permease of the major facilitator superfamily n=1 Tax=Podospora australis TaxID=1536484 RepID=A0AAN6WLM7_9PEZI|nr:permease of the major facilitator superfamily [Podospora australis]